MKLVVCQWYYVSAGAGKQIVSLRLWTTVLSSCEQNV